MCWKTRTKPVKRVAKKDIKVNKVLIYNYYTNNFHSPYYDFIWVRGVLYEQKLNVNVMTNGEDKVLYYYIKEGFHSGKNMRRKVEEYRGMHYIIYANNNLLFHHVTNKYIICDFIIPKGAEYYMNSNGDYVSDKIVFDGISKREQEILQSYLDFVSGVKFARTCEQVIK